MPSSPRARAPWAGYLPRIDLGILPAIILVALVVYVLKGGESFGDGVGYLELSTHTVSEIVHMKVWPDQPPLFFLILKAWVWLFGSAETSARTLLFASFVVLASSSYSISRRLFGSREAGLISSAMVCMNPLLLSYTLNPKYWMFVSSLTMVSVLLYMRFIERKTRAAALLWAVSVALLPLTFLPGYFVVIAFAIHLALLTAAREVKAKETVLCLVVIFLMTLPVTLKLPDAYGFLTHGGERPNDKSIVGGPASALWEVINYVLFVAGGGLPYRGAYLAFFLLSLIIGTASALRRGFQYSSVLVLIASAVFIGGYLSAGSTDVRPRHFSVLAPPLFILASGAATGVKRNWLIAAFAFVMVVPYLIFMSDFIATPGFNDWAGAADALSGRPGNDTVIVIFKEGVAQEKLCDFYLKPRGVRYRVYDPRKEIPPSSGNLTVVAVNRREWAYGIEGLGSEFNVTGTWASEGIEVFELVRRDNPKLLYSRLPKGGGSSKKAVVGGFMRECVQVCLPSGNADVSFPGVELRGGLALYAGYVDPRSKSNTPLKQTGIEVLFEGVHLAASTVPASPGYSRSVINSPAGTGSGNVTFLFSSSPGPGPCLCFNAAPL